MEFMNNLDDFYIYGGLIFVGFLWGITNPLMEKGSKSQNLA